MQTFSVELKGCEVERRLKFSKDDHFPSRLWRAVYAFLAGRFRGRHFYIDLEKFQLYSYSCSLNFSVILKLGSSNFVVLVFRAV